MEKFETKHAPGPWTLREDYQKRHKVADSQAGPGFYYKHSFIYDANGLILGDAKAIDAAGWIKTDDFEPNAVLLAAAPLLLSALLKAMECEESEYADLRASWYEEAKAAIAAAGVTVKAVEDDHA